MTFVPHTFQNRLAGKLGEFWKKETLKQIENVKNDLKEGKITIDENGVARNCIGRVVMDDLAEVIEDAFRYPTVVVAASSYDAGVFPPMHDFLYHLQIKNYQKRRFAIIENGSWAPTAGRVMRAMIEGLKDCEIVEPMITIRSRMKSTDEQLLTQLADQLI
jgi:flavorubredoxin